MLHLLHLVLVAALIFLGTASRANDRSEQIDFEDEVVEGIDKKPLDSFSQISERDRRRNAVHLYAKKRSFKRETREALRELRYIQ